MTEACARAAGSRPLTPQVGAGGRGAGGLSATLGAGGLGFRDTAGKGPGRPSSAPPARPGGSKGGLDQAWAAKVMIAPG